MANLAWKYRLCASYESFCNFIRLPLLHIFLLLYDKEVQPNTSKIRSSDFFVWLYNQLN